VESSNLKTSTLRRICGRLAPPLPDTGSGGR
jgi:hypothetical protein